MGCILKPILQATNQVQNGCSFGRNVLKKEMDAERGTYLTSGRGSSDQPDLQGSKTSSGARAEGTQRPYESGQPCSDTKTTTLQSPSTENLA